MTKKSAKPMRVLIETSVNVMDLDCFASAECDGYDDPGRCTGPVESSYPPEAECEIGDIKIVTDDDAGIPVDFSGLSVPDQDKITEAIEDAFWQRYQDERS